MKPLLALLPLVVATAALASDKGPERKPGLWRQELTFDGGAYPVPPSEMCLDAASDQKMTLVGAQMQRSRCAAYGAKRQVDGSWRLDSVCELPDGRTATTTGAARGDFRTAYSVQAVGTFEGEGKRETHTVEIKATYEGPCPKGQSGGDVTTGGKTANALTDP